jgi:hypothetical protein
MKTRHKNTGSRLGVYNSTGMVLNSVAVYNTVNFTGSLRVLDRV